MQRTDLPQAWVAGGGRARDWLPYMCTAADRPRAAALMRLGAPCRSKALSIMSASAGSDTARAFLVSGCMVLWLGAALHDAGGMRQQDNVQHISHSAGQLHRRGPQT